MCIILLFLFIYILMFYFYIVFFIDGLQEIPQILTSYYYHQRHPKDKMEELTFRVLPTLQVLHHLDLFQPESIQIPRGSGKEFVKVVQNFR